MKKLLSVILVLASSGALANTPVENNWATTQQIQNLQHEISVMQADSDHKQTDQFIKPQVYKSIKRHVFIGNLSPLLHRKPAYDASDLLEQYSSMNEQVILLKDQQALLDHLDKNGLSLDRPFLIISGGLEGQLFYNSDTIRSNTQDQGINLATGTLDMNAAVAPWADGYLSFSYNNAPQSLGNRAPDGTVYLARGFITVGDLQKSPFYVTIGKTYVPFGRYSSSMISTPLTLSMGRILTSALIAGYTQNDFNISAFGYSGSMTSDGSPIIKQGGADIGYNHLFGNYNVHIRASYVSNIADSQGMQSNGYSDLRNIPTSANPFHGFSTTYTTPQQHYGNDLVHRVGAADVNGSLKFGDFKLLGEYIMPVTAFDKNDLSFTQKGGKAQGASPKTMHVELQYQVHIKSKPVVFGLAYGHSWQALALNLPENSFSATATTSFIKDTVEAIEYRHDIDYATGDTATGAGAPNNIVGTGKSNNSVIMQLGVYF